MREAFFLPPAVIEYHVSQSLKQLFPEKACIEVDAFDVESYANAQECLLLKREIRDDLAQFFALRALYDEYGIQN